MNIIAGQGLLIQIPYADGQKCTYLRTFLVVDTDTVNQKIMLLNVSSVKGKERKLLFNSNKLLTIYRPPFMRPSFVKLDSVYIIDYFTGLDGSILHDGDLLNGTEFTDICNAHKSYTQTNQVTTVHHERGVILI